VETGESLTRLTGLSSNAVNASRLASAGVGGIKGFVVGDIKDSCAIDDPVLCCGLNIGEPFADDIAAGAGERLSDSSSVAMFFDFAKVATLLVLEAASAPFTEADVSAEDSSLEF